jgi:phage gpG-like protein
MPDIQVVVVDGGLTQLVDRVNALVNNGYKPLFTDLSKRWEQRISESFRQKADPYGTPWKKLSPFTVRIKQKKGYPEPSRQLFATGALSRSFYPIITANSLKLRSKKQEIANKHNLGGLPASNFPFRIVPQRIIIPDGQNLPVTWQQDIDESFKLLRSYLLGN